MGVKPFLLAGHFLFAAAGVITAGVLGPIVAAQIQAARPRWVVLNTGCWIAASWAYNDVQAPDAIVADFASHQASLLNFVWCNEYSGAHAPIFSPLGSGGFLEGHLFWIDRVASLPGVEAILYTNAPPAIGNFLTADQTLVAIPVLERIRRQYPEAASDVDTYLGCLYASEGYRRALAECGADWRDRADLRSGTLRPRGGGLKQSIKEFIDEQTEFAASLRENVIDRSAQVPIARGGEPWPPRRSPGSAKIVRLLDECAARYLDPANRKPLRGLMKEDFWRAAGGEAAWNAWANIVAKICKARGIKLIYYIPPHLNATEHEYQQRLKHEYVDVVRKTFSKYRNVFVIDNAAGRTLCQSDTMWHFYGMLAGSGDRTPFNSGIIPNIIGRLKSARLIVQTLAEAGLLPGCGSPPRYLGSAWPGERALPQSSLVLDYLSEPDQRKIEYYGETEDARARSSRAIEHSPDSQTPRSPSSSAPARSL